MFISLGPDISVNLDYIKAISKNSDGSARVYIDLELGMGFLDTTQSFDFLNNFLKTSGSKPETSRELKSTLDKLVKTSFTPTP